MKITKLVPRGFCKGVVDAYNITKKIIKNNNNKKKIYMIGWLVHNENIVNDLVTCGVKIVDDSKLSRLKIVEQIKDYNSIIIFSAHGTDHNAIRYAENKGFEVYDLTCEYVYKTHFLILDNIKLNKKILFIGKKNHPETMAIMSLNENITLIENINDAKKINLKNDENIFVTNQTTISIYDFLEIIDFLKNKYKNISFENEICNAAKIRQDAVINMNDDVDILIVVGDKKSSNSNKLIEIGKRKKIDCYLVSKKEEINFDWFKNKKHLAITSGCSTPTYITNDVIMTINEKYK